MNTIEEIVAKQFPCKDKFNEILNEIKVLRQDTNKQIERLDANIEKNNERIGQVEEQLKQQREEMNQRFEAVDKRFEEVDRRFDIVDNKFEKVDKRFKTVDERFEEARVERLDIKRHIIKLDSNMELFLDKITKFDAWLKVVTGNLGTEKGQKLEELFALGLSYGLKNIEIKPETIKLRQQFIDTEGSIYLKKGKFIEVDIIAENGKFTAFEVKATATTMDVNIFAKKIMLIQHQNSDKQVSGIFISPGANSEVKEFCAECEVELLD
ncbi:hypothetical protein QUF74_04620 [Candidatus Halobeggiatoa sp. HSG11]|nr:hypothetical protein [Candidatus Halobeggiatoa sp. HSG11]